MHSARSVVVCVITIVVMGMTSLADSPYSLLVTSEVVSDPDPHALPRSGFETTSEGAETPLPLASAR